MINDYKKLCIPMHFMRYMIAVIFLLNAFGSLVIMEENKFRKQLARIQQKPFAERVYVSGLPICPDAPQQNDRSWNQQLICKN